MTLAERGAQGGDGRRVAALGFLSGSGAVRLDHAELEQQAAALERFRKQRGWDLVELVNEVMPPHRNTRPALSYAIQRLGEGEASCLLVTDLGRLCRSVGELGRILDELERVGARLVCLRPAIDTGTEFGREVAQILCVLSDLERRRTAERSRRALEAARAKGAIRPAIDPRLKRRITRMRQAGMTLQAIVDELNEAGVPTVRGGAKWRVSSVQAAIGYKRPLRR
jgi:DNA invertase Pin-like site-specific DNA recombinase